MREDDGMFFYHDGRSSKGHREKPFELSESDVKRALDECFEEISARQEKLVGYVEPTMEQIDNIPDSDENLDEVDQETGGPRRRRRRRRKKKNDDDDDDDDESWKKVCSRIHI